MRGTAALCFFLLFGCGASKASTDDEIRIGLLLPYTGKDGSAGANYERGVLMAAEQVNEAGGLYGKPLRIVYADTHSSVDRGVAGAQELLDQGVIAIIGPENDELARALAPVLEGTGVTLVTPSSSSVSKSADSSLWFRLAPSGEDLGIALAKQMKSIGVQRVAIVSTTAEYEESFAAGVAKRLDAFKFPAVASELIGTGSSSFSATINDIVAAQPDAIVLAADASTGSKFVNEFAVVAGYGDIRWFLSPSLENQAFVLNSFPQVVQGMVGVAPAVSDNEAQTEQFDDAFSKRFKGSTPTTGAFFYYDALALFAIAYQGAAYASDSALPPGDAVRDHMLSASGQSGLVVEWDELPKGLKQASHGTGVYYSGLTGVISLDPYGARDTVYTRFWTIKGGGISSTEP